MIKATYQNIPVEVLDIYEAGDEKHAVVRSLEGRLFVEWGKWPTKTEYVTARLDELSDITPTPDEEPRQENLLSLALSYRDKQQWSAGETVWLWKNGNHGAYLKEGPEGIVRLWLTGYSRSVTVFLLSHKTWQWEVSRNVGASYYRWVTKIKEAAT